MKANSLVEYIGGQDPIGYQMCPLDRNSIYEISQLCSGRFSNGWHPAIKLFERGNFAFLKSMFREVQEPNEININELLNTEAL